MKVTVKEIKGKLVAVTQDFSSFSQVDEVWNDEAKEFDIFFAENKKVCVLENAGKIDKKQVYAVVGMLPENKTFKEGDKINSKDVNYIKPTW